MAEGADIIDVGAQSTRPGATIRSPDEELERLLPIIRFVPVTAILAHVTNNDASSIENLFRSLIWYLITKGPINKDPEGVRHQVGPISLLFRSLISKP